MKMEKYLVTGDFYCPQSNMEVLYKKGQIVNNLQVPNASQLIHVQQLSSAKWAIKITEKNRQELISWVQSRSDFKKYFDITNKSSFVIGQYVVSCKLDQSYQHWKSSLPKEYTEIDFETFKEITGMAEEEVPKFQKGDTVVIRQCSGDKYWYKDLIGKRYILEEETASGGWIVEGNHLMVLSALDIQKIFTIEDVRNGDCDILNDGTVEDINKVLKACFPLDKSETSGQAKFYGVHGTMKECWIELKSRLLPTQSVKLFLSQIEGDKTPIQKAVEKLGKVRVKEIIDEVAAKQPNKEWQPKWGEEVEVSMNDVVYSKAIFIAMNPDTESKSKYIIEDDVTGLKRLFYTEYCRKPLEIHTFTTEQAKQDLGKLHNLNPEQIKITE